MVHTAVTVLFQRTAAGGRGGGGQDEGLPENVGMRVERERKHGVIEVCVCVSVHFNNYLFYLC